MIQGDREDFEARSGAAARAGWPPGCRRPSTRLTARRLDDPDHAGLPPDVAQRLLAQQERIRAEIEDPPPDTGTLVRVSFPPTRLAATLTLIRAAAADSGVDAAIEGSAVTGVLDVKVPGETPAAAVARFVDALRAELGGLSQPATAAPAARAVVVYAPDEVRDADRRARAGAVAGAAAGGQGRVRPGAPDGARPAGGCGRLVTASVSSHVDWRHRHDRGHVAYASDVAYACRWRR